MSDTTTTTRTARCPKCQGPTEAFEQPGRDLPAIRCLTNGCTWTIPSTRDALQRAYRFAWAYGKHLHPCLLAADINLPDGTPCSCGYDKAADQLMDDEEALGLDFWENARAEDTP